MSLPFTVRLATIEDLAGVIALGTRVPEAPSWSEAIYREFLAPPPGSLQRRTLIVAGHRESIYERIYGFAAAAALETEAELESIAVADEARRCGIGSALLDAVLRWCAQKDAEALRLEVRAANLTAQAFYKEKGFRQVGLRRGYYRHPDDDGILMIRDIGKPSEISRLA